MNESLTAQPVKVPGRWGAGIVSVTVILLVILYFKGEYHIIPYNPCSDFAICGSTLLWILDILLVVGFVMLSLYLADRRMLHSSYTFPRVILMAFKSMVAIMILFLIIIVILGLRNSFIVGDIMSIRDVVSITAFISVFYGIWAILVAVLTGFVPILLYYKWHFIALKNQKSVL
ncbi:MAG: hypothetical protein AAB483_03270 [Patescibacteria group bacterium]